MPGPTGLLGFEARFPERFIDVGIAEQHAMTAAAGMAIAGLRPVVAIYSTFLSRAWTSGTSTSACTALPVVIVPTGPVSPATTGRATTASIDLVQALRSRAVPSSARRSQPRSDRPSRPPSRGRGLRSCGTRKRPLPGRSPLPALAESRVLLHEGNGSVIVVGIGKMARAALGAAGDLATGEQPIDVTVVDPRVVRPADADLVERLADARLVVTVEDGLAHGGAGAFLLKEAEALAGERGRIGASGRDTRHPDGIHLAG